MLKEAKRIPEEILGKVSIAVSVRAPRAWALPLTNAVLPPPRGRSGRCRFRRLRAEQGHLCALDGGVLPAPHGPGAPWALPQRRPRSVK